MKKQTQQTFVNGALTLLIATAVVKVIGAIYKIPLTNLIGADGMGFYSTAYELYTPIYSLATAGLSIAVSRLVAESAAQGKYKDVKSITKISTLLFVVFGVIGTTIVALLAKPFSVYSENPLAYYAILAVAPSLFFSCLMATYRGYYQGLKNMRPTAATQVVEVIVKAAFGLTLPYVIISRLTQEYSAFGTVLGSAMSHQHGAEMTILALAAAGAIFGVTLSTLGGFVFLLIRSAVRGDGISKEDIRLSPEPEKSSEIVKNIIKIAVPAMCIAVTTHLTTLVDLTFIIKRINVALARDTAVVLASHGGLLDGKPVEDIANYLKGCYTGLGGSLFNLIPVITGTFATSALPVVASSWAAGERDKIKSNIESVLRITLLVAVPAGFGLSALSRPILNLLYSSRPVDAAVTVPILVMLGIAAIFVGVVAPANNMLYAIGKQKYPVIFMIVGGVIKVGINYILVAVPRFNIFAAAIGTGVSYLVISILSIATLCRFAKIKFDFVSVVIKPLVSGAVCGVFALLGYNLAATTFGNTVSTFIGIVCGVLMYLLALGILKALKREDVQSLPGGKKIEAALEKLHFIG